MSGVVGGGYQQDVSCVCLIGVAEGEADGVFRLVLLVGQYFDAGAVDDAADDARRYVHVTGVYSATPGGEVQFLLVLCQKDRFVRVYLFRVGIREGDGELQAELHVTGGAEARVVR